MLSAIGTVNISPLEAAFNTDLSDQQNPLQRGIFFGSSNNVPHHYGTAAGGLVAEDSAAWEVAEDSAAGEGALVVAAPREDGRTGQRP
jgi:hypothetical protein